MMTSHRRLSQKGINSHESESAGDPELDAQVPAASLPGEEEGGGDWSGAGHREGEISDLRLS